MEASENMNGLTTGENVTKDGNTEEHDTVVQNGFGDGFASKLDKINGNHSVLVDNNSSNQSGNIDEIEDNTNNQNAENSKDLEITKDRLRVEEDMDNSTATSNVSDISAYEDSEKSMDVCENKVYHNAEKDDRDEDRTDLMEVTDVKNNETRGKMAELGSKEEGIVDSKQTEVEDKDAKSVDCRGNCTYQDNMVEENSNNTKEDDSKDSTANIDTVNDSSVSHSSNNKDNNEMQIQEKSDDETMDEKVQCQEKSNDETMDEKLQYQEKSNDETFDEKIQCQEKSNENTKTEEKSNDETIDKKTQCQEKFNDEKTQCQEKSNDEETQCQEKSNDEKTQCQEKSNDETMDEKVQCQEKSNDETIDEKTQCQEKSNDETINEKTQCQEKSNDEKMQCQEKSNDENTKSDEKSSVEDNDNKTKSEQQDENQSMDVERPALKSVEKVTDIDGSEILITINEENEDSDNEENSTKKKKTVEEEHEKQKNDNTLHKHVSKGIVILNDNPPNKVPDIAPKPAVVSQTPAPVVNASRGAFIQSSIGSTPVRFPVMSSQVLQYTLPQSASVRPPQQKYINVGGQQILITLPVSSIGSVTNTSVITTAGNSVVGSAPLMNVNMVAATFPPPNPNKNPLDKTPDIDVPQASWEQKELIKYEVLSRKPDNAFWGGLANVNKKAELSSVSKFLFDLGSDIVKESAYEQIVMVQKKKEDASQLNDTEKESLQRMKKVVQELKDKLKYIHDLPEIKCQCGYSTSSSNVMFLHKQYPHRVTLADKNHALKCAHCGQNFQGKFAEEVFSVHLSKEHSGSAKFLNKPSFWPCNLCPFEGANKSTLVKHQVKCLKNFKQRLNLAPHHVDINLSLKNIFYKFQVYNKKLQQAHIATVERPDTRGNELPIAQKPAVQQNKPSIQPKPSKARPPVVNPNRPIMPSQFQPAQVTGISPSNTWQNNYSRILQTGNVQVEGPRYAQIQQPPPPLKPSANKPTVNQLLKTQQTSSMTNRTGFEVCEICGGYVKDRMSLRIHFFYAHKIEMPAHVFSKPLAPLFCNTCNERFWTSQGFAKHKTGVKHMQNLKKLDSVTNQCWICHQKPENLYSHLHKFHRLTTGECMALKRCMFCGILSHSRKELELHMAATHGVLIKGDEKTDNNTASKPAPPPKSIPPSISSTKNLSTVVTGGSSGMVRNNFCVFCSAQFPDNTKLTLHCLSVHATCKKCGMVVNKASDLGRHVCKMSSKTCSICGLKNLKPAGLIKHLETHTRPCKVALKRLSPHQIVQATEGKYRRVQRLQDSDSDKRKQPFTVAIKHDKEKCQNKLIVALDEKKGNTKDEVVIESDDDSDVIIQEEEKTEIILDSDIEDDNVNKAKETEKMDETEKTDESRTGNKIEESEREKKCDQTEKEGNVDHTKSKSEKSDSELKDKMDLEEENKTNDKKDHEEENDVENNKTDELKTDNIQKQGSEINDCKNEESMHSNDSSNVAMETENSVDSKSSDSNPSKSKKRSHSDSGDDDIVQEDTKKRKSDD